MPDNMPGIHHVTCITGDVQKNVDFYVGVLGLRFVKKSINQDVPDTYHLYFADYLGTPGTAMTFFGWPHLPWRPPGSGQVATVAFAVPNASLDYWSRRFKELHIEATRASRFDADSIVVKDFDGIEIELVGKASDDHWVPWPDSPVDLAHQIRGFHSVTMCVAKAEATVRLLTGVMGFRRVGQEGKTTRFETGAGGPGAAVDLLEAPEAPVGEEAAGTVHHVAWRAPDDAGQVAWRDVLINAGRNVTPVIDRYYFKSIYYREPGGVLFEIATDQPGFTVDEAPDKLGSGLSLPPWFQVSREKLDHNLTPIVVPTTAARGAIH